MQALSLIPRYQIISFTQAPFARGLRLELHSRPCPPAEAAKMGYPIPDELRKQDNKKKRKREKVVCDENGPYASS